MFFYLGENCELLEKQSTRLFTDLGWKKLDNILYKGYCLDYNLEDKIQNILSGDRLQGLYCVVDNDKVFYPNLRPFPLYKKDNNLTNLRLDNFIEIKNCSFNLPVDDKSFDVVVKNITEIICNNLSNHELNIWCTGGVDSTMLLALAEHAKLNYTLHVTKPTNKYNNIKIHEGTVEEYNSDLLDFCRKNYWAYEFLSVFKNATITTGFYGDSVFCRTVYQLKILLSACNSNMLDVVKPNHYIYKHLLRNYKSIPNLTENDFNINIENAKNKLLETSIGPQVWHFDNTITFCPLFDERIIENIYSLDIKTLLDCAVDATIQKEIIKNTKPDVLLLIDKHKNTINDRQNFFENISKVKLSYCKELVVH